MITPSESFTTPTDSSPSPAFEQNDDPKGQAAIDNELISRFLAGDESAFVEIMRRYRVKILNVSFGLLRNHADAEEVTQDTFIRVHRGLVNFRGTSSFTTWLFRIAINLSHNRYWYHFRRRRQDTLSLDQPLALDSPATFADLVSDDTQDPARETMTAEFSALVAKCMAQLDARHREILNLRTSLNHSYEEIATALGINTGTVKSRIARARVNLRALLSEACPEFSRSAELSEWLLPTHSGRENQSLTAA